MKGTLIIKPLCAKIFHDTSAIFKMDPYVRVIVGDQLLNSPVCVMGGKTPSWNNVQMLMKDVIDSSIRFELWDKNKLSEDDLIGFSDLSLSQLSDNKFVDWIPIRRDYFLAGELLVEIQLRPDLEIESKDQGTEIGNMKSVPTPMFLTENPGMGLMGDQEEIVQESIGTTIDEEK